jgi:hypothetical protein
MPASGQATESKSLQIHSSSTSPTAEQCEFGKSDQQRPDLPAAAAANVTADSNNGTGDLRLPGVKADSSVDAQQKLECKKDEGKQRTSSSKLSSKATVPGNAGSAPPLVAYSNGILTITAHNALFSDVLEAIRARTGAVVEFPAGIGKDRVYDTIGPAPMREVLTALLEGSEFNYVMLSSPSDPRIVHRIILTARQASSNAVAAAPPSPRQATTESNSPGFAGDTTQNIEEEPAPTAPPLKAVVPSLGGKSLQEQAAALQEANPQMTRGEIVGELQRRHNEELDQQAPQAPDAPQ